MAQMLRSAQTAQRCLHKFQRPSIRSIPGLARRVCARATADKAESGDTVSVNYTGTLDDGEVFDTSLKEGRTPLEFTIGSGMVIAGFDIAVTGLGVGESNKARIEPKDAYGAWDPTKEAHVPRADAPDGLEAGMMVQLGNGMPAKVTEVTDTEVSIDMNHMLAGKALTFEVELMSLKKGSA